MGDYRLSREERSDVSWWYRYGLKYVLVTIAIVTIISLGFAFVVRPLFLDADARARRASYERQDTARDFIADKIVEWNTAEDGQRIYLTNQICQKADEVRGTLSPTSEIWVAENC